MDHRPLLEDERRKLMEALRGNAKGLAMLTGRDTGFVGTADDLPDEEVVAAIKSVPCHYGA